MSKSSSLFLNQCREQWENQRFKFIRCFKAGCEKMAINAEKEGNRIYGDHQERIHGLSSIWVGPLKEVCWARRRSSKHHVQRHSTVRVGVLQERLVLLSAAAILFVHLPTGILKLGQDALLDYSRAVPIWFVYHLGTTPYWMAAEWFLEIEYC